MAIELHIKIEKAGQVSLLGIDGALGLLGHLRAEYRLARAIKLVFGSWAGGAKTFP